MLAIFKNIFSNKNTSAMKEKYSDDALLVDVRSPEEFVQGNVKGSINIPVDQILNHLDKFRDQNEIVVFCRSGMRSGLAKSTLEKNGFTNVTNGGTWQSVEKSVNR